MNHLLHPDNVAALTQYAASNVLLAFDFDGTLAPIVPEREEARMRPRTRALLERLCHLYPCVVISGRSRDDVERRIEGLPVRRIVGNHGLEPGDHLSRFEREMAEIRPQLEASLGQLAGVDIEDKRFSLAVHYRRSRRKADARRAIHDALARLALPVRAIPGKLVINVVPGIAPHKGDALTRLRAQVGADTAIYVGDDVTDEDVFLLDQPGRLLSVRIGSSRSSAAAYYLRDQREMDVLLARLVKAREGGGDAPPGVEARSDMTAGAAGELMRGLWRLNHALEQVSRRMEATSGVTAQQRMMLRWIAKYPGMTASQLAAQFHLDGGTISSALSRLEGKGLLERGRDHRDHRRVTLGLTAAGREIDRVVSGSVDRALETLVATQSSADLERTSVVLRTLADLLEGEGLRDEKGEGESDGASSDIRGR